RRRRIRHGLPLRAAGAAARCGHSAPYFAVGSLKLYPWPASKSTTEGRPIKKTRANCVFEFLAWNVLESSLVDVFDSHSLVPTPHSVFPAAVVIVLLPSTVSKVWPSITRRTITTWSAWVRSVPLR